MKLEEKNRLHVWVAPMYLVACTVAIGAGMGWKAVLVFVGGAVCWDLLRAVR